jgi:DNA mismatch repair protein MSH5
MAVDLKDGQTVGCAFFETDNGVLLLCTDVPMADLDVMEQLLAHIQPTTVLAPARAPEHLLIFLEERSAAERDGKSLHGSKMLYLDKL